MKRFAIIAVLVVLVFGPLALSGEFKGTDDQASNQIAANHPGFTPWMHPLWQPPSAEIESLLFALQAAIGAGVLGYVIGRRHGTRKDNRSTDVHH